MPGWVGIDAEAWLGAGQARGTQREYPGLGLGDVADLEVQAGPGADSGSGERGGW